MAHPRIVFDKLKQTYIVTYEPLPRQRLLHSTTSAQVLFGGAAGGGKATCISYRLHTLDGYISMAEVKPGDMIMCPSGLQRVTGISEIDENPDSYEVELDTGENKEYIVELYREGIPPKIIGELLGLEHSYNAKYVETGGFYEKKEITFKDECKQAQAESKIKLIMAATTDPKPNDALRFLTANEATRSMYKAPKDEREAIKIEFLGFSRGEPEDIAGEAPNFSELKEKPKLN